jgi:hypothetical protein
MTEIVLKVANNIHNHNLTFVYYKFSRFVILYCCILTQTNIQITPVNLNELTFRQ